jgi:hypothetical protein
MLVIQRFPSFIRDYRISSLFMDSKTKTLINLIDDALKIAEDRLLRRRDGSHDVAPLSGLQAVVDALRERKARAREGKLQPFEGNNWVGLNRELLEWGEWGTALFQALESVEEFYRNNFSSPPSPKGK